MCMTMHLSALWYGFSSVDLCFAFFATEPLSLTLNHMRASEYHCSFHPHVRLNFIFKFNEPLTDIRNNGGLSLQTFNVILNFTQTDIHNLHNRWQQHIRNNAWWRDMVSQTPLRTSVVGDNQSNHMHSSNEAPIIMSCCDGRSSYSHMDGIRHVIFCSDWGGLMRLLLPGRQCNVPMDTLQLTLVCINLWIATVLYSVATANILPDALHICKQQYTGYICT